MTFDPVPFLHITAFLPYSTAQPQVNKRVRVTHECERVMLRELASHSRALDASHVSAKGVNCTACGSEIACASASKIAIVSITVSANKTASASNIASASKIVHTSKSRVQ